MEIGAFRLSVESNANVPIIELEGIRKNADDPGSTIATIGDRCVGGRMETRRTKAKEKDDDRLQ